MPGPSALVGLALSAVLLGDVVALAVVDAPERLGTAAPVAAARPPSAAPTSAAPSPALPSAPAPSPAAPRSEAPTVAARPLPPARVLFGLTRDLSDEPGPPPTVVTVLPTGGRPARRPSALPFRLAQVSAVDGLVVSSKVLFETAGPTVSSVESGIVLRRASTGEEEVVTRGGFDSQPVWSPDGSRVAYQSLVRKPGGAEQYVVGLLDRTGRDLGPYALPPAGQSDASPAWSPDGRALVVVRTRSTDRGPQSRLVLLREDGPARTLADGQWADPAWSPDGRTLVAALAPRPGRSDLHTVDVASGAVQRLTTLASTGQVEADASCLLGAGVPAVTAPVWSPDGRLVAFLNSHRRLADEARQSDLQVVDVRSRAVRTLYEPPPPRCRATATGDEVPGVQLYGWVR